MLRNIITQATCVAEKCAPKNIYGIFKHSAHWIASPGTEMVSKNPNSLSDKRIVIYCIHGTFDEVSAFDELVPRLLQDLSPDFSEIRVVSFSRRWQGIGIKTYAYQLLEMILANKDTDVFFVGHSRGGLIVSYLIEFLAKQYGINVHGACIVSSPFLGTPFAIKPFTFFSKSIRDMRKGSEFLKTLGEKVQNSLIDYLYFVGLSDLIVTEDTACIKEHTHLLHKINKHGHLSILFSPELADQIKKFLDKQAEVIQKRRELMVEQLNQDLSIIPSNAKQIIAEYTVELKQN